MEFSAKRREVHAERAISELALERAVTGFRPNPVDYYESRRFAWDEFKNDSDEQTIVLWRSVAGHKEQFRDIADFWLQILFGECDRLDDAGFRKRAGQSLCLGIAPDAALQRMRLLLAELKAECVLPIEEDLLQSVLMYEDWNEVALVWETSTTYGAFSWDTTA